MVPERFRGTRLDPGHRGVATLAALGLAAVLVAVVLVLRDRPVAQSVPVPVAHAVTPTSQAKSASPGPAAGHTGASGAPKTPDTAPVPELVISVIGLVPRGGLLHLPAGSRVADALTAAGGTGPEADLSGLNLAQRLQDGDQIVIGPPGPTPTKPGSTTVAAGGHAPPKPGTPHSPAARVNLNTASESELDALPGIGPVTARAILTWRTAHGAFTDAAQLTEIDGIGPAKFARLRDLVSV
ncbi:ComEA family DNA-binding protein [Nocardia panacis]|uniref:ComEA family DNA-binding protein n=1 Tax=Nocardia panacis TaxID=2340916 RepID=A0A3A4KBX8_9NOCA|nr:ComEA family DNA-binding protein [Nocardia panacis]